MKILADENILDCEKYFSAFGELHIKAGREITNKDLIDVDILLVRSVTQVNQHLLANSKVKYIGTATIGTDHIDLDHLHKNNIAFRACAGCNANAVAEYVITALFHRFSLNDLQTKTIAIVGYGNVGKALANWLEKLNINFIINDPPIAAKDKKEHYIDLKGALQADIISLHTPLTTTGKWPTKYLINKSNIGHIKQGATLINTARGGVIDNHALLNSAKDKRLHLILDVWENEPDPISDLVQLANIATPHIAGYSYQGKLNASVMLNHWLADCLKKPEAIIQKPQKDKDANIQKNFEKAFIDNYCIQQDSETFKQITTVNNPATFFDRQRKNYSLRQELAPI